MDKVQTARLIIDYFQRSMMHNAMWFAEVQHQLGREKAYEVMKITADRSYDIHMKRLAKILDYELEEGIPKPMLDMPEEKLDELKKGIAVNWLAMDGVWFQAVEFAYSMNDAKRCNDSTWGQFSPFEAWSIKKLLGLTENPGLEGLKTALQYRLYASINKQSFHDECDCSFVFRMDDCRVQSARKRKGMKDYPCKSGGLVEYKTFAEAIDSRISTECISCPPDPHPEEYYCSWKFRLVQSE